MCGKDLREEYGDVVEFIGLCDSNLKRVQVAKGFIAARKSIEQKRPVKYEN